jgi:hypothetical protein
VGEREGTAEFVVTVTSGESRLAAPGDRDEVQASSASLASLTTVPVVTIDAFCARERIEPAFIKIDVEGWELAVLRGARETIRRRRGALALFVELHPSAWPVLGTGREQLLDELREQRLELVSLTGDDHDIWAIEGVAVGLRPR